MTAEENKRMLALLYIIADLKAENMELVERVQQIAAEYSNAVCQSGVQEKRKDKDQLKQTLVKLRDTEEQCYKLERENRNLKRFAKAMRAFVEDKNLYIKKDNECPYWHRGIPVCSTYCLECKSCLGVIEDHGVICEKRLKEANVSLLSGVGEVSLAEASAVFPNDE